MWESKKAQEFQVNGEYSECVRPLESLRWLMVPLLRLQAKKLVPASLSSASQSLRKEGAEKIVRP